MGPKLRSVLIGLLVVGIFLGSLFIWKSAQKPVKIVPTVENNIRLAMNIEKNEYLLGETIKITFELKNDSSENILVDHPYGYGIFVFDVYNENNVLLGLWPGNGLDIFSTTRISAGEAHGENLLWDQKVYKIRGGFAGGPVNSLEPGKYFIQGWIESYVGNWGEGTFTLHTSSLEITIK